MIRPCARRLPPLLVLTLLSALAQVRAEPGSVLGPEAPALYAEAAVLYAEAAVLYAEAAVLHAESGLFQDRLLRPRNHFLVDGQHAFVSGVEFYQADAAYPFLWPSQPYLRLRPDLDWLADTARVAFRGEVGNEVGDPLLGELVGVSGSDNHTPLTTGGVSVSGGSLRFFAGLDQNDHFSFRTLPRRTGMVGEENRERMSWVGGNLPPKSQAQLGAAWKHGPSRLAVNGNVGWWWTASPVSGQVYPWEGFNGNALYRYSEVFDASLDAQEWSLERAGPFYASRFRRYEANLGLPFVLGSWSLRLEMGYARRILASDSAFTPVDQSGFPAALGYRQAGSSLLGLPIEAGNDGFVSVREGLLSAQHAARLRETWGRHGFGQGLKVYYRGRLGEFASPVEHFREEALPAAYLPGKHARGWAASADYVHAWEAFRVGAELIHALEWQAPLFRGETRREGETLLRSGALASSDHALANGSLDLSASGEAGGAAAWRVKAGTRKFYGRDADHMEYSPSPWWTEAGGTFSFPSDLRLEARLHRLGPKRVRGWGGDFRVPSHWENNLGLAQSLFRDRLELSVSALHAFGREVREHPDGNPLRFRLLVGCRGSI